VITLKRAKDLVEPDWLDKPNVIGICTGPETTAGLETGRDAVVVFVTRKVPMCHLHESEIVPPETNGHPTDVAVASFDPLAHTDKRRPFMSGHQIGIDGSASCSTLGMVCRIAGQDYGIGCWHGMSDNAECDPVGRMVTQPGNASTRSRLPDGTLGPNELIVGEITHSASPFEANVDAAAFSLHDSKDPERPQRGWNAPGKYWDRQIDQWQRTWSPRGPCCGFPHHHGLYDADTSEGQYRSLFPAGVRDAKKGREVWKSGYRTGVTQMSVFATDLTVYMRYFGEQTTLTDQIALTGTDKITATGDSGSAVIDSARYVVGILYAGGGSFAVACPIKLTLRTLFGDVMEGLNLGE